MRIIILLLFGFMAAAIAQTQTKIKLTDRYWKLDELYFDSLRVPQKKVTKIFLKNDGVIVSTENNVEKYGKWELVNNNKGLKLFYPSEEEKYFKISYLNYGILVLVFDATQESGKKTKIEMRFVEK